jgi:hypothetical protein
MARCSVTTGVVGHISGDGGPKADIGHLACESAACGSTTMPTGAWHCAAVTYDAAAIRVYLNGTLDNAPPQTFNDSLLNPFLYPDPPAFPTGGIFAPRAGQPAADLAFGANYIDHGHGRKLTPWGFGGVIRSFAVWAEALPPAGVNAACTLLRGASLPPPSG